MCKVHTQFTARCIIHVIMQCQTSVFLCIIQRGVRPQVVTTFELPGCSDMWTVLSNSKETQVHIYMHVLYMYIHTLYMYMYMYMYMYNVSVQWHV